MKGASYCILILISSVFADRIPQRNDPDKKYLGGLENRNSVLEPSIPLYTNSYEDPSVYYEPCQSFGFLFKSLSALLRIIPPIFAYGQVLSLLFGSCSASTVTTTSTSAFVTFNTVTDISTSTSTSLSTFSTFSQTVATTVSPFTISQTFLFIFRRIFFTTVTRTTISSSSSFSSSSSTNFFAFSRRDAALEAHHWGGNLDFGGGEEEEDTISLSTDLNAAKGEEQLMVWSVTDQVEGSVDENGFFNLYEGNEDAP